jgi:RND family efflux transporter MFP subunit
MILSGSTAGAATALPRAVLVLGLVALPLLPIWGAGEPPGGQPPAKEKPDPIGGRPAPPPKADKEQTEPEAADVGLTGRVVPANVIRVSARIPGEVVKVNAQAGAVVKKGDLLFELEDSRLKLEVEQAQAKLSLARATFDHAARSFKAARSTQVEVETAKAGLVVAETNLRLAMLNLEATKITAPIDGTILSLNAQVGAPADQGRTGLCELADLRRLEVVGDVTEADLKKVKVGQRCEVRAFKYDATRRGEVKFISPVLNPETNTAQVRVALEPAAKDDGLLPGTFVSVTILKKE